MAVIVRRVDDMLRSLRAGRPHNDPATLLHATYLCNMTGRCDQLVAVAGEWFRQSRPLFDRMDWFKASSVLCNLGKANRATAGGTVRTLGWPPIEYFARRMLRMGLDRFQAEDVASALSGINDLVKFSEKDSNGNRGGEISSCLRSVLSAFELYLAGKCEADDDWPSLVREVAPMALHFISAIYTTTKISRNDRLVRLLLKLSVTGFDDILAGVSRKEKTVDFWRIIYSSTSMVFAEACISLAVDPESICPDSWRSWFDVYLLSLERHNALTITDFDLAIKLAYHFPSFRLSAFWPQFNVWYERLEKYLRAITADLGSTSRRTIDLVSTLTKSINMLYKVANLVEACAYDDTFQCRQSYFQTLAALLDDLIASIDEISNAPTVLIYRLLAGYRRMHAALQPRSVLPSHRLYHRLRQWLRVTRGDRTRTLAVDAAAITHLVQALQPPVFLLDELALSFHHGVRHLPTGDAAKALADFGMSCVQLNYDPAAVAEDSRAMVTFWNVYFEKADEVLRKALSWNAGSDYCRHTEQRLLYALPLIAVRFEGQTEFERIRDVYEKRLRQQWKHLTPASRTAFAAVLGNLLDTGKG